ncbi:ATP-binding protein [Pseudomonas songnenensis]|uniref:histidine kinase n=1 Tax=Pseudomonas songnenensis TaxID=1176259 RepID=A0ABX9UNP1_9PSED|nr:ATP-binding protein [Pseudomonas songnenensis]MCQ4301965.1 ATP-binding protein [Pseudomonas songnenensis]RMH94024.1 HAMP domain-containing protein [Pseudomonas songnenensis]
MLKRSIRQRTLALLLGTLLVSLSLISWRSYRDASHEIEELFDAQLAQSARLVQGLVGHEMDPQARRALQEALDAAVNARRDQGVPGHDYETKLGFQVYAADGSTLLQSAGAPNGALQQLQAGLGATAAPLARLSAGYHDVMLDGHAWRLFLLHDREDDLWILLSERGDVRGELVGKIARRSLLPDLIGLPLLALLIWFAVGWGLRPLARMAQLLKRRDPDNLAPLLLAPLPQELEPVAASLNRLLQQVNQLIEREKRFIADAAHELRTPLAVLRIHAQNAQQAQDEQERAEALEQLVVGVDRTTRVVTQLLTLARLEPSAQQLRLAPLDLRALARETLAELTPLAIAQDQALTLEVDEQADCRLTGDAASLTTMLQNLVGNALEYTPHGGRIEVQLHGDAGQLILAVDDSGPGISTELRPQLFERFFRLGGGQGAGLGLSIVARIAELHGASVELLDSPLGGLRVLVRLPRRLPVTAS